MVSELESIKVGDFFVKKFIFTKEAVELFSQLVDDRAPIHIDKSFAISKGLEENIVHGFFISSIFSGILGQKLPGPNTVINLFNIKFHTKVYLNEQIIFKVQVLSITKSVKAVSLSLEAINLNDIKVISGDTICSFI
jgi:3-hydroxybutyryl-CoA dehydratase